MGTEATETKQIEIVLTKLRNKSRHIGEYQHHTKTEDGDYIVDLSNGKILLYSSEIKSADHLPDVRIVDIQARFQLKAKA